MIIELNYDIYHRNKVEQEILGAIMNSDAKSGVKEILIKHNLVPEDFRARLHQQIYDCILKCFGNNLLPTILNIRHFRPAQYLANNSNEFDVQIAYLLNHSLVTTTSLEPDIMFLKQYVLFDYWNRVGHDVLYGNWNQRDVLQVGDNIINGYKLLFMRLTDRLKVIDDNTYSNEIKRKVERLNKGLSTGITTSVKEIDDFTGGYSLGELVIIAARPGMGKTTYALISGWNSAMAGNVVVFFSLEMPANQLKSKLIGLLTGIDYKRIKKGSLSSEELAAVLEADKYIDSSNFHIDDKAKTIEEITERANNYIKNFGAKLFFLDYIQRTTSRDTKVQIRELVTIISRELKSIARDNYVAMVALSQLSRAVEARPNKRPKLSDLKESSSIEEDADIVAFLFRQAYYDEMEGQQPGFSEMFHTEFIVAKGRDIGTDVIHLFINPINMTINGYNSQGEY